MLQKKILGESRVVEEKIKQFCEDWAASKPLEGTLNFAAALDNVKAFEGRLGKLKEEHGRIAKAREAMELPVVADDRLPPVEEEMKDLKVRTCVCVFVLVLVCLRASGRYIPVLCVRHSLTPDTGRVVGAVARVGRSGRAARDALGQRAAQEDPHCTR